MNVKYQLSDLIAKCIESLYGLPPNEKLTQIQATRKEFKGDYTLVVFPFTSVSKKNPEETAQEIGKCLLEYPKLIHDFNVIKGFLNITLNPDSWNRFVFQYYQNPAFGLRSSDIGSDTIMIEFSSPNTNKPLHLGHIRNILLGDALANILEAAGNRVYRVNLVNDRGIHICKSMLAWKEYGNGITPEIAGIKGDHLVGNFYVKFDVEYREEVRLLQEQGLDQEQAKKEAPLMQRAQEMLRLWEQDEVETIKLWKTMNQWVYKGFEETYRKLDVKFDMINYESETYKLGKDIVLSGLDEGLLTQDDDGSIWADLTSVGLDRKILLRADGTSVYITQDIGTAVSRFINYNIDRHIYVVGNEQNYHFQVLKHIIETLGYSFANRIFHFAYGMVELPDGKMKSREGKVVDADDLYQEMIDTAMDSASSSSKLDKIPELEINEVVRKIALAALKYFILKVDPKKTMTFSPSESIDFNGNTGPFIQYTYARTASILRSALEQDIQFDYQVSTELVSLHEIEILLIKQLHDFPEIIQEAASNLSPALIANFLYNLAKEFNRFYHEMPILKANSEHERTLRLQICSLTGQVIKSGMALLGIPVPERM